jgi:hypothetical protein
MNIYSKAYENALESSAKYCSRERFGVNPAAVAKAASAFDPMDHAGYQAPRPLLHVV